MNGTQRFPMDIPFGWFCIGYSDEVAVGDVKPLRYFGKDLVMFRGESGEIGVLDAYCPHLGAHMGHGGTVEGDSLRCPFHHWA
ncbi:Rieske (2Fe-2S) protein, partial [Burkholderia multivorans]